MRSSIPPVSDSPSDWSAYLLERTPAMIAYVDTAMRYRYASPAYLAWMNVGDVDVVGRPVAEVIDPALCALIEPDIRAALGGTAMVADRAIRNSAGDHYAQATFSPDVDADGKDRKSVV